MEIDPPATQQSLGACPVHCEAHHGIHVPLQAADALAFSVDLPQAQHGILAS